MMPPSLCKSVSALLLLLSLATAHWSQAAHLPAVRREPDSKRVLASRLIRSADRHKERSLRDVLGESGAAARPARQEERARMRRRNVDREDVLREGKVQAGEKEEDEEEDDDNDDEVVHGTHGIKTMSELFQWAINNTVRTGNESTVFAVHEADVVTVERGAPAKAVEVGEGVSGEATARVGEGVGASPRKALPPGKARFRRESVRNARRKRQQPSSGGRAGAKATDEDLEILTSKSESEYDVMRRNVHVLDTDRVSAAKKVRALLMLEELCHSIDNGRDLQISGGIEPVLRALGSRHDKVRASAAWALATCCQNNPPVQNASLALDAVPILSRLAAQDQSANVRSRALFALNAMLELESARAAFEELPYAIDAVRNALVDTSNFRATRRALNLTELLVQKNLDAWKTQLEAWDIPILVEQLMRSHPDIDVRESAARTIAALDGRPVA